MKPLIILKLGGSVITDKASVAPKANLENIIRLGKEIFEAYSSEKFRLILIHGAGSFGHGIVKETGIDKGINKKEDLLAFAEVQRLQNALNVMVTQEFIKAGIPSMPCQASSHAVMENGRIVKMEVETISGLLDIGIVPVLYGVPAFDIAQGCSILSGDQIAPFLAKKLGAKKIIHGTDVDGIFTADPKKDPNAELIKLITKENIEPVKKLLGGSSVTDVTGGMLGKVEEVERTGIEAQIINALKPENVRRALLGEGVGTIIRL